MDRRRGEGRRVRGGSTGAARGAAGRPRRLRPWAIALASVALALALYAGAMQARQAAYAARLPAMPDPSTLPAAIAQHVRAADRLAREEPTSVEAVGALCVAYHADLLTEEAGRCYAYLDQLKPRDWRWTYYRGLAASEREASEAVAGIMRRVVEAAPAFGQAWCRLGDAELKARRYDSAEEAWRRAMVLPEPRAADPAGAPPHVASAPLSLYATAGLARVALARGDAERARQILEDVVPKAARTGFVFRLLGDAYAALNRPADAARATRVADSLPTTEPYVDPMMDALARESRSSTFLLRQAAATDFSGGSAWREYLIRRALEFDPDNPDVVFELGTTLRRLDRHDEALELLQRRERMVSGDFQVLGEIGRALAALGRFTEAESYLRRALQGADDAVNHYDLALVLTRLGRQEEAVAEYQRALDRHPNDVDARSNLAVRLINLGRLPEAVRELERVIAIDPDHALAHTNLGVVFSAQGQRDRAARAFLEALRINPAQAEASEGLRALGR